MCWFLRCIMRVVGCLLVDARCAQRVECCMLHVFFMFALCCAC